MADKKLWQSAETPLNTLIEAYTVGDDYLTDGELLPFDLRASEAHGAMLHKQGVLSDDEWRALQKGLREIGELWEQGRFSIRPEQEDGHTAIEQFLTEKYGEAGKKIHTGRSRNDQALVMLRLFMKERLDSLRQSLRSLAETFRTAAGRHTTQAMPGYTHLQRAMPTTVGVWLASFAEALEDVLLLLPGLQKLIDQNPLGSASGFGIANFKNDRTFTTRKLGFARVQENPIYCAHSRGSFENIFLSTLAPAMLIAGRFANDMLLFSSAEFNFLALPPEYTTGSSIMPQKRNYDLFEIMRGNVRRYLHWQREVEDITAGLFSGYQRDLQLTKRPFTRAVALLENTLRVLLETVPRLIVNRAALEAAMSEELFLTEKVYERVNRGLSFRQAYHQVKKEWRAKP